MGTNWREKNELLVERCIDFTVIVLEMFRDFPRLPEASEIRKQLARSSGSVGANLEEAFGSHGPADFAYRLTVSRKEARESWLWLRVVRRMHWGDEKKVGAITEEARQLVCILSSMAKNAKASSPGP